MSGHLKHLGNGLSNNFLNPDDGVNYTLVVSADSFAGNPNSSTSSEGTSVEWGFTVTVGGGTQTNVEVTITAENISFNGYEGSAADFVSAPGFTVTYNGDTLYGGSWTLTAASLAVGSYAIQLGGSAGSNHLVSENRSGSGVVEASIAASSDQVPTSTPTSASHQATIGAAPDLTFAISADDTSADTNQTVTGYFDVDALNCNHANPRMTVWFGYHNGATRPASPPTEVDLAGFTRTSGWTSFSSGGIDYWSAVYTRASMTIGTSATVTLSASVGSTGGTLSLNAEGFSDEDQTVTGAGQVDITITATVTQDATSGKYTPANATEWSTFMTSLGMGSKVPTHLWPCQDAASPLVDVIGGANMSAHGTTTGFTYQTAVAGWSRLAAYNPASGGGWITGSGAAVDPSAQSVAMLVYARVDSASSFRTICSINHGTAGNTDALACYLNSSVYLVAGCDTVTESTRVNHVDSTVHPYLLVYNRTNGSFIVYSDKGVVSATYSGSILTNGMSLSRNGTFSAPQIYYLYACAWEGAAAEFTPDEARALIDGLGFSTSTWWTVDATSNKVIPSTTGEWDTLLHFKRLNTKFTSPNSIYLCQEASGNLVDTAAVASLHLNAGGTGHTFQNVVSGWSRFAVGLSNDTTGYWHNVLAPAPDATIESTMIMMIGAFGNPTNHRTMAQIGTFVRFRCTVNEQPQILGDSVTSTSGTNTYQDVVQPWVFRHDIVNTRQNVYSESEKLLHWDTIGSASRYIGIGSSGDGACGQRILAAFRWSDGPSCERSDADIKLLQQALNWSPSWDDRSVHIRKSAGTDGSYDGSAYSLDTYTGTLSVTWKDAQGASSAYAVGVSTDNPNASYTGIDRGFVLDAGTLYWNENGALTNVGTYVANDTFEVRRTSGTNAVTGYKNGVLVHTGTALAGTLLVDTSLRFTGDVIGGLVVSHNSAVQSPGWGTVNAVVT